MFSQFPVAGGEMYREHGLFVLSLSSLIFLYEYYMDLHGQLCLLVHFSCAARHFFLLDI